MCYAIGVTLGADYVTGLLQRAMHKTVLGIHDVCLRVVASFLDNAACSSIAGCHHLRGLGKSTYHALGLAVVLQQLDGQPASGIAETQRTV